MVKHYDFFRHKYGEELLIDFIRLESLEKYIIDGKPHKLGYYDITIITEGEGFFHIDDARMPIKQGSIFITQPFQIRKWEISRVPAGLVLIFEEEFLCHFFNDKHFVKNLSYFKPGCLNHSMSLTEDDLYYIQGVLSNIETEIESFKTNDIHILRALLYQALIWINRKFTDLEIKTELPAKNRYSSSFYEILELNYQTQHQVNFYADKLHITPGHLNDLIKSISGKSVKQVILDKIILEAKRMIEYTDLPISEIAFKLNFTDNSYFVRLFKKNTGFTPLTYRERHKP